MTITPRFLLALDLVILVMFWVMIRALPELPERAEGAAEQLSIGSARPRPSTSGFGAGGGMAVRSGGLAPARPAASAPGAGTEEGELPGTPLVTSLPAADVAGGSADRARASQAFPRALLRDAQARSGAWNEGSMASLRAAAGRVAALVAQSGVRAKRLELAAVAAPKAKAKATVPAGPVAPVPAVRPEPAKAKTAVPAQPAEPPSVTTLDTYRSSIAAAKRAIEQKEWAGAVKVLDQLLKLEDIVAEQRAWALHLKAKAERGRGNLRLAARLYAESIDLDPPGVASKNSLAWIMATAPRGLRDPDHAVKLAEEAVAQGGAKAAYLDTLARAYFEAGRIPDAIRAQERSLAKAPGFDSYQRRLSWYKDEQRAKAGPIPGDE